MLEWKRWFKHRKKQRLFSTPTTVCVGGGGGARRQFLQTSDGFDLRWNNSSTSSHWLRHSHHNSVPESCCGRARCQNHCTDGLHCGFAFCCDHGHKGMLPDSFKLGGEAIDWTSLVGHALSNASQLNTPLTSPVGVHWHNKCLFVIM